MMSESYLYFAYGSNLLTKRLHINNPSAVRYGIGKIQNFRLDFNTYSNRWRGASATIVPTPNYCVWGAIWKLDMKDMKSLDRQEGVELNLYFAFDVDVMLPNGGSCKCRVYQQTNAPTICDSITKLPEERLPSVSYLNTIKSGAKESGLPQEYLKFLDKIPNNGCDAEPNLKLSLDE